MSYTVLFRRCTYQDDSGADYVLYCSDGFIRYKNYLNYSSDYTDGGTESLATAHEPLWITKEGKQIVPSKMTPDHRSA